MKVFMIILIFMLELHAADQLQLVGKWEGITQTTNQGTRITEKEYFNLNSDRTFSLIMLVNLKKDQAFVRDLRIEGSGIWKVKDDTLILVINKVDVPFAKEIYLISQESLRNLADTFKHQFEDEPIRVNTIKSADNNHLILVNEASKETHYTR